VSEAVMQIEGRLPPGPAEPYQPAEDLFTWINKNFARFGDIFKATIYGDDVYVVSNPDYCERILRHNWRNYARSGQVVKRIGLLLGNGLISSNGEFWARQRRMIQPSFTKNAVSKFAALMASANAELLAQWIQAAREARLVNVTKDVSAMVLKITLSSIFSEDYASVAPQFGILADDPQRNLKFAQAFRSQSRVISDLAAQRRRDGVRRSDILDAMMHARGRDTGEAMRDVQLANEALTLVVAGHETTAGLLNWLWYLLARHPEVDAKLAASLEASPWDGDISFEALARNRYAQQVIEEALRLYPPLWLMTRRALQEDRLGAFYVPKNTEMYISPYLIQRSPALWEEPDRFNPERMCSSEVARRPELSMCPFGAGARNCIGEWFARMEMQIHVMMFARALRLIYDTVAPAEMTTGMNLLSKHDFLMLPELR